MKTNFRKGFTLIEILIVVAIIAILASVVLVGLGPTQQSGRDARRLSDLRETQTGLELYYAKCGYYPGGTESGSCGAFAAVSTPAWTPMSTALTGSAIGVTSVPQDPTSGHTYYYSTDNVGAGYLLQATLENANNSAFENYTAPATGAYTAGDSVKNSCKNPTYCLTL